MQYRHLATSSRLRNGFGVGLISTGLSEHRPNGMAVGLASQGEKETHMMDGGMGWGSWIFGAVIMVGFWALAFWAIVSLVRRPGSSSDARTAQEILGERFARGDIDSDEYARRRDVLPAG